jgi:hypothetical protein
MAYKWSCVYILGFKTEGLFRFLCHVRHLFFHLSQVCDKGRMLFINTSKRDYFKRYSLTTLLAIRQADPLNELPNNIFVKMSPNSAFSGWRTNPCLVRFQVLTASSIKMAVFWVVAPCSLVKFYRHFRGACCLHHQGDEYLDDGGSKYLWKVG